MKMRQCSELQTVVAVGSLGGGRLNANKTNTSSKYQPSIHLHFIVLDDKYRDFQISLSPRPRNSLEMGVEVGGSNSLTGLSVCPSDEVWRRKMRLRPVYFCSPSCCPHSSTGTICVLLISMSDGEVKTYWPL